MNTTKINHKNVLMNKLHEIENTPGNWDGLNGSRVSPRSVGQYKAFLEMVTEYKLEYSPELQHDGSILVAWTGRLNNNSAKFGIHFLIDGKVQLIFGEQVSDPIVPSSDKERIQTFIYASG